MSDSGIIVSGAETKNNENWLTEFSGTNLRIGQTICVNNKSVLLNRKYD